MQNYFNFPSLLRNLFTILKMVSLIDTFFPFRLTFYICSVGFTSPMLFDERKHPYHLMLQKFVLCGGQDAFFEYVLFTFVLFVINKNK